MKTIDAGERGCAESEEIRLAQAFGVGEGVGDIDDRVMHPVSAVAATQNGLAVAADIPGHAYARLKE